MLTLIIAFSVVGCLLIFAEIYIPGGILGTLGVICFIGAVTLSYMEYGFGVGNLMLVGLSVLSLAALALGLHFFPHTPIGRRLQLGAAIDSPTEHPDYHELVGSRGTALSSLRPAGVARFGGTRYDVVSQGGLIASGAEIEVIHTEGSRIVVREVEKETAA